MKRQPSDFSLYLLMGAVIKHCLADYTMDIEGKIEQFRQSYERIDNGNITKDHLAILKSKRNEMIKDREDAKFFFTSENSWFKKTNISFEYLLANKDKILYDI